MSPLPLHKGLARSPMNGSPRVICISPKITVFRFLQGAHQGGIRVEEIRDPCPPRKRQQAPAIYHLSPPGEDTARRQPWVVGKRDFIKTLDLQPP